MAYAIRNNRYRLGDGGEPAMSGIATFGLERERLATLDIAIAVAAVVLASQ